MGLRTPLYEVHAAAGAKLVDFAGWDMPMHYGSQVAEHHAVRRDAGMFDVSHMLAVDVEGEDARPYLRRLLANDVAKLTSEGKALYSCLLNEQGGVIDDLIVYFFAPDRYRIVVNAGTADKDVAWFKKEAQGTDVLITPRRDLAMIAVQGPNARARTWQAFAEIRAASEPLPAFSAVEVHDTHAGDWLVARTGYTGEDGFELTLPAAAAPSAWQRLAAAGVACCGLGCRDTLRLEAGMNLYGQDMDETVTPMECGLAWSVAISGEAQAGRDFIGKRALAAKPVRRQLLGLVLEERGVLRSHQAVHSDHGTGEITSGTFSPTLEKGIALARLPIAVAAGDKVGVDIRGKTHAARVVKPPFVRNGRALV